VLLRCSDCCCDSRYFTTLLHTIHRLRFIPIAVVLLFHLVRYVGLRVLFVWLRCSHLFIAFVPQLPPHCCIWLRRNCYTPPFTLFLYSLRYDYTTFLRSFRSFVSLVLCSLLFVLRCSLLFPICWVLDEQLGQVLVLGLGSTFGLPAGCLVHYIVDWWLFWNVLRCFVVVRCSLVILLRCLLLIRLLRLRLITLRCRYVTAIRLRCVLVSVAVYVGLPRVCTFVRPVLVRIALYVYVNVPVRCPFGCVVTPHYPRLRWVLLRSPPHTVTTPRGWTFARVWFSITLGLVVVTVVTVLRSLVGLPFRTFTRCRWIRFVRSCSRSVRCLRSAGLFTLFRSVTLPFVYVALRLLIYLFLLFVFVTLRLLRLWWFRSLICYVTFRCRLRLPVPICVTLVPPRLRCRLFCSCYVVVTLPHIVTVTLFSGWCVVMIWVWFGWICYVTLVPLPLPVTRLRLFAHCRYTLPCYVAPTLLLRCLLITHITRYITLLLLVPVWMVGCSTFPFVTLFIVLRLISVLRLPRSLLGWFVAFTFYRTVYVTPFTLRLFVGTPFGYGAICAAFAIYLACCWPLPLRVIPLLRLHPCPCLFITIAERYTLFYGVTVTVIWVTVYITYYHYAHPARCYWFPAITVTFWIVTGGVTVTVVVHLR